MGVRQQICVTLSSCPFPNATLFRNMYFLILNVQGQTGFCILRGKERKSPFIRPLHIVTYMAEPHPVLWKRAIPCTTLPPPRPLVRSVIHSVRKRGCPRAPPLHTCRSTAAPTLPRCVHFDLTLTFLLSQSTVPQLYQEACDTFCEDSASLPISASTI